jgi:hypothetical protein
MSYGTVKVDTIIYTSGGLDASGTISGIVNGNFPSVQTTGVISGSTVTGATGNFTVINAVTGVFTSTLSGTTFTGTTGNFASINSATGSFSSGLTLQSGNATLNSQSEARFADSDSSNWVAFKASATIASNVTWTLPSGDGTSGQVLQTNGSGVFGWTTPLGDYIITVTATGKTLTNRERCTITASGQTLTLPASPSAGNEVTVTIAGTFLDTVVARNGSNIMSLAEDLTVDKGNISVTLYYVDATRGWRII